MSLPFRRRGRPRGTPRLAAVNDIQAATQWLGQISTGPADGTTWPPPDGPAAVIFESRDTEPLARYRTRPRYRPPAAAAPEPPAPRPPAIRPLAPELPPREGLPAVQVTAMLGAIRYPGADGTPEDYAAVMRRWSHLTGTVSGLESPGAWPRHAIAGAAHGTAGAS